MSSGQKAWEDAKREDAFAEHCQRLQTLGCARIAQISDRLRDELERLERQIQVASRSGWATFDEVKKLLGELS